MNNDISEQYRWFKDNIDMYLSELECACKTYLDSPKINAYICDIYNYFNEMYNDPDKRFFNKFYNVFMDRYSNENNHFKFSIFRNRAYYSFFINLYMIMKGYKYHHNNFSNFDKLVDDVFNYDICYDSLATLYKNEKMVNALLMISSSVINRENYSDMPNLRHLLQKILFSFNSSNEFYDTVDCWSKINKFDLDISSFDEGKISSKEKEKIIEALLEEKDKSYFCSDILFYGNRFFYLNEKLFEIEDNDFIRNSIFSEIEKLNPEVFFHKGKDYFEYYMDIVFDSDSYKELKLKLKVLQEFSDDYTYLGIREGFSKLDSLVDIKDVYNGRKVVYPVDMHCINIGSKPKKIIERMKASYSFIDNDIDLDFIDITHDSNMSLDELIFRLEYILNNGDVGLRKDVDIKEKKKGFLSFFRNKCVK